MIIDVTNEVFTNIKSKLTGITVLTSYPSTTPTFPCVLVEELSNTNYPRSNDSAGEHHNSVTLEINIFSDSQNKVSEVKSIRNQIDELMSNTYNMNRTFSGTVPNFLDTNVYRYILRYTFVIDSNKQIYRG